MFTIYAANHPAGFTANVVTTAANKGVLLALVSMAQTIVVLTSGIDLSVGMVFVLTNCLASYVVVGSPAETAFGAAAVLLVGLLCGVLNGLIVIYGRLQPIVATIATGAIYYGIALALRPVPGGDVNSDLADSLTNELPGGIPASLFDARRGRSGDLGSVAPLRDRAWYLCGWLLGTGRIHVGRAGPPRKIYRLLPLGAARGHGGLFLTFLTYSGEASAANGNTYTLYSIAAVVLGGVSLFGGAGSAIGAIFGALMFRTIGDLLFVFDLDPLWQPLFQGVILLAAVCLGSFRLFRIRNRLELFG